MRKKYKDKKYESLIITEEEKKSVEAYSGFDYSLYNNLLEPGVENEMEYYTTGTLVEFNAERIGRMINSITNMYSAMYKNGMEYGTETRVSRGTSVEDIERLKKNGKINKFLSTSLDDNMARGYFSLNWKNPAYVDIYADKEVPWILMKTSIGEKEYGDNWEKELLLAPFTKIKQIEENQSTQIEKVNGSARQRNYSMHIEKQELHMLSEEEEEYIQEEVVNNADMQNENIMKVLSIKKQIEKLEQNISLKRQNIIDCRKEMMEARRSGNVKLERDCKEDIALLEEEIENTEKIIEEKQLDEKQLAQEVDNWKNKFRMVCMSKCKRKELEIDKNVEQEEKKYDEIAEKDRLERRNSTINNIKDKVCTYINKISDKANENINIINNVLNNENDYEKVSEELGIKYNKILTNPDELIKAQNELNNYITSLQENTIKTLNTEINDNNMHNVLFALGHPITEFYEDIYKSMLSVDNSKQMQIQQLQDNSIKKGIYDKFFMIKSEVDFDKLEKEYNQINNRGTIRKIFDKITGKEQINQEKLQILRNSMDKISADRNYIERNLNVIKDEDYSAHEMYADMEMFIEENKDNPEILKKIKEVDNLKNGISKVFKIEEERIENIKNEKNRNKYPELIGEKKGRLEIIAEMRKKSYEFLKNNGYAKRDVSKENGLNEYKVDSGILEANGMCDEIKQTSMLIRNYLRENVIENEIDRDFEKE